MRKFHAIQHQNGRHRVDFFQDKDGAWRYQPVALVKKRWRTISDLAGPFDSYALALVHANQALPWIILALDENPEWRHKWHLELLRGLAFRFARFDESQHSDHAHCSACWKTLVPDHSAGPDMDHEGYLTRYFIPDGSGKWQWNWLCTACFQDLRAALLWQESSD